jgi:transposase InsO family protein
VVGVTAHPNAEWLARQLTEACGWDEPPRYLIRDRDGAYGAAFIRRIRAMGIRDRPVSARSPWQNGYAGRLIGSIRRECRDHVVVVGERHLRHVLASYQKYYNEVRTHLSLQKDAPVRRNRARAFVPDLGRATPSICSSLSFRQGHLLPSRVPRLYSLQAYCPASRCRCHLLPVQSGQ